jgi:hypothetical protein
MAGSGWQFAGEASDARIGREARRCFMGWLDDRSERGGEGKMAPHREDSGKKKIGGKKGNKWNEDGINIIQAFLFIFDFSGNRGA